MEPQTASDTQETTFETVAVQPGSSVASRAEKDEGDKALSGQPSGDECRVMLYAYWGVFLLFSFCTSGVIFGWPALVLVLNEERVYTELCEDRTNPLNCKQRSIRLNLIFSAGFFCLLGGRLGWGLLLDRVGPKWTSFSSAVTIMIGAVLFGASLDTGNDIDMYMPAYALIGLGGPGIHLSSFHASNLFPKMKRTVTASFSGVFGTSGLVFVLLRAAYVQGVGAATLLYFYAGLAGCVSIGYLVLQPSRNFKLGDRIARSKYFCSITAYSPTSSAKPGVNGDVLTFQDALINWKILGLAAFFAVSFLHLQFYLGQAEDILNRLGDRGHGNVYLMAFNIIGSSALAIFYPVGLLLDRSTFDAAFSVSLILAAVFNILSYIDYLPIQIIAFICWCISRMLLFAGYFSFIPATVGFQRFGVVSGTTSAAAAVVGLLNIPLTSLSIQLNSHKPVMGGFLLALGLLAIFPFQLRRDRLEAQSKQQTPATDP